VVQWDVVEDLGADIGQGAGLVAPIAAALGAADADNCPIEPFIAVATLHGWAHRCDLFALQDAAGTVARVPRLRKTRSPLIGRLPPPARPTSTVLGG
jgi:hypothetical protein